MLQGFVLYLYIRHLYRCSLLLEANESCDIALMRLLISTELHFLHLPHSLCSPSPHLSCHCCVLCAMNTTPTPLCSYQFSQLFLYLLPLANSLARHNVADWVSNFKIWCCANQQKKNYVSADKHEIRRLFICVLEQFLQTIVFAVDAITSV